MRRAATLLLVAVIFAASNAAADPREDYILHCRGCHGAEGAGVRGAVPALRGQVAVFLAASGGREYLLRVPGTSQSELSDARIAALMNWILAEFDPDDVPDGFRWYTEEEVAAARHPALADVEGLRQRLLAEATGHGRKPHVQ